MAMRTRFRKIFSADESDELTNRVQASVEGALAQIKAGIFDDAEVISNVTLLGASGTIVPHGLGRKPRGYLIIGASLSASVYDSPSPAPTKVLKLHTDANVVVTLLVF